MHLIMTLELIPQLEPIPTWNRLHQWLFWPMESLWNRLQKNWNRYISSREGGKGDSVEVCGARAATRAEMASPDDAEIPSPFLKEGKLKKEG